METFEKKLNREREPSREQKEVKEQEIDPELAAAAMMERADVLVKEVKSNKQQVANILMHMSQVKQLITQLRNQLQLQHDDDGNSLAQDAKQVEKLQKQIAEHKEELLNMREDLLQIYTVELQKNQPHLSQEECEKQAEAMLSSLLEQAEQ